MTKTPTRSKARPQSTYRRQEPLNWTKIGKDQRTLVDAIKGIFYERYVFGPTYSGGRAPWLVDRHIRHSREEVDKELLHAKDPGQLLSLKMKRRRRGVNPSMAWEFVIVTDELWKQALEELFDEGKLYAYRFEKTGVGNEVIVKKLAAADVAFAETARLSTKNLDAYMVRHGNMEPPI